MLDFTPAVLAGVISTPGPWINLPAAKSPIKQGLRTILLFNWNGKIALL